MRISWLGLAACLAFWACGSDESDDFGGTSEPADAEISGNEDPDTGDKQEPGEKQEPGDKQEPGAKSEPEAKRDTTDKEYYIKSNLEATGDFSIDSVYDRYTGSYTYRIRTGNIVWYSQRVTEKATGDSSVCYNRQNGNCRDYGRLFLATDSKTERACPDSTRLPTIREWNVLESYRAKYAVIDTLMDLKYGGSCAMDSVLRCSGKDTTGYYLASDGKVYMRKKGREKASFIKAKDSSFYNIRCVGYPDFVESKRELPACDTTRRNPETRVYVFGEKENYRCYPEKGWLPDFSESCPSKGKSIVYNDTMMICLDGIWQVADLEYSPDTCNAKTKDSLMWFNGVNYYCTGESWRNLTPLEDSIGVCNKRRAGVNDTVIAGINIELYHCDSSEWRKAELSDYVGSCDDSSSVHMNDTIDFKNTRYICRGNGWSRYTELEERFGACTPEKLFMFENGTYNSAKMQYICDSTGWVTYSLEVVVGKCDSTMTGTIVKSGNYYSICRSSGWTYVGTLENTYDSVRVCIGKNNRHVMDGQDDPEKPYTKTQICYYDTVNSNYTLSYKEFPKCYKEDEGKVYSYSEPGAREYYCGGAGYWHNYFDDLPLCTTKNMGELATSKDYGRVACTEKGWRNISDLEAKYGVCSIGNNETVKEFDGEKFICLQEDWRRFKDPSTYRLQGKIGEGR
jgi:uncharacterized protein (TIGR02145 family)